MKVAIFDVDGKIPNLALMKLSAFHKSQGDSVELYSPLFKHDYDKIYASKIFKFSDRSMLDESRMTIGGTGWDLKKNLPDEIESLVPDYSLYGYPHNIGFTQRGCRLKCSFCVVPEKEGKPCGVNTIDELWTQRDSDFLVLLDNDFFGNPQWQDRIDEIADMRLKVSFSQGLNIRNMKQNQAEALAKVNFSNLNGTKKQVHFAWDDPRHEKLIHKGLRTCFDAGIKAYQMAFFVLIGYLSTPEEDLHRVEVLRSYGVDPFAMPYNKENYYQRTFARWVNRREIFKTVPWAEYGPGMKNRDIDENQLVLAL